MQGFIGGITFKHILIEINDNGVCDEISSFGVIKDSKFRWFNYLTISLDDVEILYFIVYNRTITSFKEF